jgi:hypothetical protein
MQIVLKKLCGIKSFILMKPNIFFEKHKKTSDKDAISEYETIVHEICDKPYEQKK